MADPNVISAAPFVEFIKPYVEVIVQAGVAAIVTWVAVLDQKWTGFQIQQSSLDKIKSAAATQAGILVANAADNLHSQVVTVNTPGVATAAAWVAQQLPEAAAAVGATPEAIQNMVVGEIGKLQALTVPANPANPTGGAS